MSQIADKKFSYTTLSGGLSINLNHLKTHAIDLVCVDLDHVDLVCRWGVYVDLDYVDLDEVYVDQGFIDLIHVDLVCIYLVYLDCIYRSSVRSSLSSCTLYRHDLALNR